MRIWPAPKTSSAASYKTVKPRTLQESSDSNDNLDGISKGRVQKASHSLAKTSRHILSRVAEQLRVAEFNTTSCIRRFSTYLCQRHDGDEAKAKTEGSIPIEVMGHRTERHEEEEDVDPRAKDEPSVRVKPRRLALGFDDLYDALAPGQTVARLAISVGVAEERSRF